jgi:hypothetical protein
LSYTSKPSGEGDENKDFPEGAFSVASEGVLYPWGLLLWSAAKQLYHYKYKEGRSMNRYGFVVICLLVVVVVAGTGWAGPYRILHRQGAIYTLGTGWNVNTPPYYPGVDWAADMVSNSQGVTILHKDGALWSETGGWNVNTPPYYPGTNYAQALDAGPEEVRMPISSLPYTITESGSYYITGNLTSTGNGIIVDAFNVTIDLMGYSLIGPGTGTSYGINIGTVENVEVRNGVVTNFKFGISVGDAYQIRVIALRAVSNSGIGIYINTEALVKDCTASGNGVNGIEVGRGSTVTGNIANHNSHNGIYVGYGSTVTGNTAYANQYNGIFLENQSLVDGNTAYYNNLSGGSYKNIAPCATCTWGLNHHPGD